MKKPTAITSLIDFLFPRYCTVCGKKLGWDEDEMCLFCNMDLRRTYHWLSDSDNRMEQLYWGKVHIEKAMGYFYFRPSTSNSSLIYEFKYNHRPDLAEKLGRMMALEIAGSGFFDDIDCLVPVPLSIGRKKERGYNQSEMIARGLHKVTGIPVLSHVIVRKDFGESQTHLTREEREKNVENAFSLVCGEDIRGKHVLLLDDVITTGATTTYCAKELLQAEGVRVSVLCLGFAYKNPEVK